MMLTTGEFWYTISSYTRILRKVIKVETEVELNAYLTIHFPESSFQIIVKLWTKSSKNTPNGLRTTRKNQAARRKPIPRPNANPSRRTNRYRHPGHQRRNHRHQGRKNLIWTELLFLHPPNSAFYSKWRKNPLHRFLSLKPQPSSPTQRTPPNTSR